VLIGKMAENKNVTIENECHGCVSIREELFPFEAFDGIVYIDQECCGVDGKTYLEIRYCPVCGKRINNA